MSKLGRQKFSFPVLTNILAMMFIGLVFGACTQEDDNKVIPGANSEAVTAVPMKKNQQLQQGHIETTSSDAHINLKIGQWETIQETALANYDICLENCGNTSECMDNCEQAYVQGLAAEYKFLLHE